MFFRGVILRRGSESVVKRGEALRRVQSIVAQKRGLSSLSFSFSSSPSFSSTSACSLKKGRKGSERVYSSLFTESATVLLLRRNFATDEEGFHPDFKTIRKKYEEKESGKSPEKVKAFIKEEVEKHPVVLFMKGVPEAPQCGFSNLVCRILKEEGVTQFRAINVLADPEIRQGIKDYTEWPTIPQLFINQEFVGGCDIVKSLYETGELSKMLEKAGVIEA